MTRVALAALCALMVALPTLSAQDTTSAQKRGQPTAADTTRPTAAAPTMPAAPGTPLEQLVNQEAQRRANIARILLLTNAQVVNQQDALKQLSDEIYGDEQLVTATHDQLQSINEGMRRQSTTMLVVLFAADSAEAAGVKGFAVAVDGANTVSFTPSDTLTTALRAGGAAELFRGGVLAAPHTVGLTVTVNGRPQTQWVRVKAQVDAVTYVQFAMQDGQLLQTTWASRGTNPF